LRAKKGFLFVAIAAAQEMAKRPYETIKRYCLKRIKLLNRRVRKDYRKRTL